MLSGLPASGKSTRAREIVKHQGMVGRVNRDDIRAMMFDKWSVTREKIVVEVEKAIAEILFKYNHNAIIDDTNLTDGNKDMWSNFVKERGAKFDYEYLDVSIQECIARDALRSEKSVGPAVIARLALNGGKIAWGTKRINIIDLDGTVANGRHREHLCHGPEKDWFKYFNLMHLDKPYNHIIDWVNELGKDDWNVVVTGRPDTYQYQTLRWLNEVHMKFDFIFMRSGSDSREDTIIKREILNKLPKEQINLVIEDRMRVVKAYKEELAGFPARVIPVAGIGGEY